MNPRHPTRGVRTWKKASVVCCRHLSLLIAVAFVLLVAGAGDLRAQDDYLGVIGVPPFTTALPVESGFINIASGTLRLEVPLGSWPQRGGREFKATLIYDSGIIGTNPNAYDVSNYIGGGWHLATSADMGGYNTGRDEEEYECPYPFEEQQTGYQVWSLIWTGPDGTSHEFEANIHNSYQTECGTYNAWTGGADSFADDASGYHLLMDSNGVVTVHAPDGTVVYCESTNCNARDTNGNYYSQTFDGYGAPLTWIDSLNRTLVSQSTSGNYIYYDVRDSTGGTRTFTVTKSNISVGYWPFTVSVPTSIALPDNAGAYSFTYNSNGLLASMTLPTGGTVSYSYATGSFGNFVSGRTTNGGSWTYVPELVANCSSSNPKQFKVTVTTPSGDKSVYNFTTNGGNWPTQADYYNGAISSSNLLASVTQTFVGNAGLGGSYSYGGVCPVPWAPNYDKYVLKTSTTTTLPAPDNTLKQTVQYCYDSYSQIKEVRQWKFYTGSTPAYDCSATSQAHRTTQTTYVTSSSYVNKYIVNRVASTVVKDGSTVVAETLNAYDGGSLTSVTGVTHHDDTNYGTGNTVRGNLTQVQRRISGSGSCTSSTCLTKTMAYDTAGVMVSETDWNGNTTTYDYTDNFFTDGGNGSNPSPYSPSVTAHAYPKTVTSPSVGGSSLVTTYGYYWGTGQKALVTDPNNQTTYFHFYDPLNRPTLTKLPNSGWTYTEYTSATQVDTGIGITSTSFTTSCSGSSGDCRSDRTILDSLGRVSAKKLRSDPDGETTVDTTYDSAGRLLTASNPHRSGSASTDGITTTQYDGLNRALSVAQPDGRAALTVYGKNVSGTGGAGGTTQQGYASTGIYGYPVLTIDEAGKARQMWYDGFGRLIEVDEPSASSSGATSGSGNQTVTGTEQSSPNGGTPGTGSVTISGGLEGGNVWDDCAYLDENDECVGDWVWEYDDGTVAITVNGSTKSVCFSMYAGCGYRDTPAEIATALASAINADGNYPVTASVSGATITLTAKQVGSGTNYSLSTQVNQSFGSFTATPSGSTLSGGQTYYQYDAGTVWITVNGVQMSTTYGQGSTTSTVASSLASVINANTLSPVTASVSSAVITLTAKTTGTASNYTVSSGASTNYPAVFSSPSFSVSVNNLANGTNTGGMSSPLVTLYTYDSNNNLTGVTQGSQTRSFTYDMLSRLTQAVNPESGTTDLYYTTSGGSLCSGDPSKVCRRVRPAPNQIESATVTTTYSYDALNRLTGVDYSDSTPDVTYSYDQSSYNGLTITNGKTRRTGMSDGSGTTAWSYDSLGNVMEKKQTVGSITQGITYTYNKDSSLATVTYPGGRTVTYTTKGAQRQTKAEDITNSIVYAQTALYAAHGSLSSLTNGASNAVLSTLYYNKRLQPCRIAVNSSGTAPGSCDDNSNTGNVMDLKYDFGLGVSNNGNVLGITNKITSARSQTFTYDALNRIATAAASTYSQSPTHCWGESFTIDAYGNLTGISNLSSAYNGCTNTENFSVTVSSSTNRISTSGYCYDSAGNLVRETGGCSTTPFTYVYDAENRLTSTAGVTYTYDGDGKRVKADQTSGSTYDRLYWFGMGLDALAESDLSGNLTEEYVFFGNRRVARRNVSSGNVYHYLADHLGTSRAIIQAGQTSPCYDADFYPYGGERVVTNTCSQKYKFTGKERDAESGLDNFGARYNSSWTGRFMSPDLPFVDQNPGEPQSWNLYAYARNNPLKFTDPTGRCVKSEDATASTGVGDICKSAKELRVDENGKKFIKDHETVGGKANLEVYLDNAKEKNPTVGYGHKVLPEDNLKERDTISQETADAFFEKDVKTAENDVKDLVGDLPLSQNEFNALADLAYNVGRTELNQTNSPKLNQAIKDKDYAEMSNQLKYTHVDRSNDRRTLFLGNTKAP